MRNISVRILRRLGMYGIANMLLLWVLAKWGSLSRGFAPKAEKISFNSWSIRKGTESTTYRGIPALRCPFDYVIYQMILSELRPDLVIEIGTFKGGGALYLGDLMSTLGHGTVHTIDIESKSAEIVREHPRIKLFTEGWEKYDTAQAQQFAKILVIEDGSHIFEQTLGALHKFAPLVSVGSYLIVEDGILSELGLARQFSYNGGPLRAIREFLKSNSNFRVDTRWCDFFGRNATWNVNGYLLRVR